jgi:LuxR family maltose regulon positive regulatory protein
VHRGPPAPRLVVSLGSVPPSKSPTNTVSVAVAMGATRATAQVPLPRMSGFLAARTSVPAPPAGMVERSSLRGVLDGATQRRLTIVSAGPGWGKTSTLADWASGQSAVTGLAWLSLVRSDDSLSSFWSAVLHALRRSGRIPDENVLARLSPAHGVSEQMLQATYEGIQALPSALVLVLDDFHVIEDAAVLDSVARLLLHDLPLHLVLAARSEPVLPLHRLRLSGQLSEIVADDLAFGQEELAALSHTAGLDLDLSSIQRVLDRTGGWPAGARMATLHLSRPGVARDLSDFAGSDRSVAEYLMAEVLDAQSPSGREFLLRTSVVGAVCAPLANTLVPRAQGQRRLEQLAHSNQFVTELGP